MLRSETGQLRWLSDLGLASKVLVVCCDRQRRIKHFDLVRGLFYNGPKRWWCDEVGEIFHQQLHVLRIRDKRIERLFNFGSRSFL